MSEMNAGRYESMKLAQTVRGVDNYAPHIVNADGENLKDVVQRNNMAKLDREIGDLQERFRKYTDAFNDIAKQMANDLSNVEIMPLNSYVLVSPYPTNPFQQMRTENVGGIELVTDLGGLAPTYKSQESGEFEQETAEIVAGMVVETGPECKFLEPGDIVFYHDRSSAHVVPFFKFGFKAVAEQRIIAVVNAGLTARKKDVMSGQHGDA